MSLEAGVHLDLYVVLQLQFLFPLILRGLSGCKLSQIAVKVFYFKS